MFRICALNESSSEAESDTEQNQVDILGSGKPKSLNSIVGRDQRSTGGPPAATIHLLLAAFGQRQQDCSQDQLPADHQLPLVPVWGR